MMPFVGTLARGESNVAAAAFVVAPVAVSTPAAMRGGDASDELSLLVVGAFLLGLGFVLRRVA
jgi:hypothetical protein